MQSPYFHADHWKMPSLHRAAAALTLLSVLVVGAWETYSAAWGIDLLDVPRTESDFREGRTTSALEKQIDKKLPLRKTLIAVANSLRFLLTGGGGEQVRVGRHEWLFLTEELRFDTAGGANLNARAELLGAAARELDGMGVKLVVALVPDKARVYPEYLSGGRYPEYNRPRYRDTLKALRSRNIAVIDLLEPLTSGATQSDVYYRTDTHWNHTGAKIAADTIAAVVKQMGIDLGDTTPFSTTTSDETVERPGDLIRLMGLEDTTEALRPRADREAPSETIQISTDNSSGLFGDAGVPVVLTGTSYSLRGNFHGFLQQALAAKVLNAAKDGGGFLQAITDYLKDDSFRLAKPKLLIWEVPERFVCSEIDGESTWLKEVGFKR